MSRLTGAEAYGLMGAYTSVYAPQELTEEQVWEEVENWVNNLLEEGYDLSDYTWGEMYEEYLSEDVEQLDEAPVTGNQFIDRFLQGGEAFLQGKPRPTGVVTPEIRRAQEYRDVGGKGAPPDGWRPGMPTVAPNPKPKPTETPETPPQKPTETPPPKPTETPQKPTETPPPKPAASSPVLSKKNGVEGTGVGANFKARAFTTAEKSRYASVAAKNSATSRTSPTSTPAPKPPGAGQLNPGGRAGNNDLEGKTFSTGTTAGGTKFERRTPTSAEMDAAKTAGGGEAGVKAAVERGQPTTGPTPAILNANSIKTDFATANSSAVINRPAPPGTALAAQQVQQAKQPKPAPPMTQTSSYEWPSGKTIKDLADAYTSIYEGKKKDQDEDGDTDFADVIIARMIASGMTKAEAIAAVRNKEYNEEYELAEIMRHQEERDAIKRRKKMPRYTPPTRGIHGEIERREAQRPPSRLRSGSLPKEIDEATRMRKELGKEGEIAIRQELARRSKEYQRSGSVDRTIAAAERGAANPYVMRGKNETEADYNNRKQKQSKTLTKLAANRRGSVRSGEGLRGYAAKVEGDDEDLQAARGSARSAGTLTPAEKTKMKESYYIIASYLLENNFANTQDSANIIIENMSETWIEEILKDKD